MKAQIVTGDINEILEQIFGDSSAPETVREMTKEQEKVHNDLNTYRDEMCDYTSNPDNNKIEMFALEHSLHRVFHLIDSKILVGPSINQLEELVDVEGDHPDGAIYKITVERVKTFEATGKYVEKESNDE